MHINDNTITKDILINLLGSKLKDKKFTLNRFLLVIVFILLYCIATTNISFIESKNVRQDIYEIKLDSGISTQKIMACLRKYYQIDSIYNMNRLNYFLLTKKKIMDICIK